MTRAGDRYGPAAQAVVDSAYAEAAHRSTGPAATTVDDLVAALRASDDPVVGPVLEALGVPEHPIPVSAPVHRPADAGLVRVLLAAASVAGRFGAAEIEPVHLLLAALPEPDGAPSAADSTIEQIRRRIVGGYLDVRGAADAVDSAVRRAVVDAGARAGRAGAAETGPDHLLLALAAVDEPAVADALSVLAAHESSPGDDPARPATGPPLSMAVHEAFAWAMCLLVDGDDTTAARSAPPTVSVADLARALLDQAVAAGSALLDRHGVDPRRVRADIDRRLADAAVERQREHEQRLTLLAQRRTGPPGRLRGWARQAFVEPATARALDEAMRLVVEAERDHSLAKADRAVWLYERILANTSVDDPYRLRRTVAAAMAYLTRSTITGSADGLTTGLWYAHLATDGLPAGDPLFGPALGLYASMIVHDQDMRGEAADLPQAIAVARRAVAVARAGRPEPGQDPNTDLLSPSLDALDNAAQLWFAASGSRQFADLAVVAGVGALRHSDPHHPKRVALLSNLSRALAARTMVLPGPDADRARAIRLGEAAVRRCPPGYPERVLALTNLGIALLNAPPGWPVDHQRAVDLSRQVLDLTPVDHPQRPRRLANLADAARLYAEHGGGSPALDAAVDRATEACAAASTGVIQAHTLSALGSALVTRYDWWAEQSDLDEALVRTAEAVQACPDGHRDRWAYLGNYAVIAADRWKALGDEHARDTALEVSTRLLAELPHWHRDRPAALAMHALRVKSVGRIDEAVELGEAAVRAAEEALPAADVGAAADLVIWLNNLVSIYRARWRQAGDATDLDRAVEAGERGTRVLARMPSEAASAVSAAQLRYGLSLALQDRYRQRRGLDPDPSADPQRPAGTISGDAAAGEPADPVAGRDAEAASAGWRQVLQDPSLPVDLLVSSAVELAGLHAGRGELAAAADGYRAALEQLPRLSWRGRSRSGQEDALARWQLLGVDAAAVAVAGGDPGTGVELLDQARGVLWGQLLDDRSAARRLRRTHPALADRLAAAGAGLDAAGGRGGW